MLICVTPPSRHFWRWFSLRWEKRWRDRLWWLIPHQKLWKIFRRAPLWKPIANHFLTMQIACKMCFTKKTQLYRTILIWPWSPQKAIWMAKHTSFNEKTPNPPNLSVVTPKKETPFKVLPQKLKMPPSKRRNIDPNHQCLGDSTWNFSGAYIPKTKT